jgi:hypothetical protein
VQGELEKFSFRADRLIFFRRKAKPIAGELALRWGMSIYHGDKAVQYRVPPAKMSVRDHRAAVDRNMLGRNELGFDAALSPFFEQHAHEIPVAKTALARL